MASTAANTREAARPIMDPSPQDLAARRWSDGRLASLRVTRYSWWVHWRELANYFLPRRYRWVVTPNLLNRGSPINQNILDSTGVIAARDLAAGLMSGKCSPTRPWFKLKIGRLDSTQTSPASLWLAECERLMYLVFHESNFYNSIAQFFQDLVTFGTAVIILYENFENVIMCENPCAGEFYVDLDGCNRPTILYREYTYTIGQTVDEFGQANCSQTVIDAYNEADGSGRTREIIIAHSIEPNDDGRGPSFGFTDRFKFRELYWECGAQSGASGQSTNLSRGFLRKKGFYEQPQATVRWEITSNDPYGRCPAMDALPDNKQLQLESRRKAQGIDKMVNPPLVADVQLKNQPASLLPGGVTYVSNFSASGKPGFASVYDTKFPINEMMEDLEEVRTRIRKTMFNDLFKTASQYETKSNITTVEWDMRKSEDLVMLGPAMERVDNEGLALIIERVFAMCQRAGILPPPPASIAGKAMTIEFHSILAQAQDAAQATGIERLLSMAGNLVGVDPAVMDNIDIDFALDKYSSMLNNDPRIIRSPDALAAIRQQRDYQQQQQARSEQAQQLSQSAANLSKTDVGGGKNALQLMTGQP